MAHFKTRRTQIWQKLKPLLAFGQSKTEVKKRAVQEWEENQDLRKQYTKSQYVNNAIRDKIYSHQTLDTYKKHLEYFADWLDATGKPKNMKACKKFAGEFLQSRIDAGMSPWTVSMEAAALGKLYQCPVGDFNIKLPTRARRNIKRSRGTAERDRHFSLENNAELVSFCRSTGLRRSELQALKGCDLVEIDGAYKIHVRSGKGGRQRDVTIIGSPEEIRAVIDRMKNTPPDTLVWGKVHSAADIHGYRADYANKLYQQLARPLGSLKRKEKYCCQRDMSGINFDRAALMEVSENLGHSRVDVVAGNYMRPPQSR